MIYQKYLIRFYITYMPALNKGYYYIKTKNIECREDDLECEYPRRHRAVC